MPCTFQYPLQKNRVNGTKYVIYCSAIIESSFNSIPPYDRKKSLTLINEFETNILHFQ